ncbi:hypothetical protein CCACVL1_05836 [Corchorus capsularis]|uniref:NFU1 iron-sulfur cluster protein n=1 Tax=Corchorus capsularis TaxID=210143 RepID=A0A1R3JIV8_COCAP|nr:hypothetical protein CCACVL1_05836 [Corchorus capsularis]
MAFRSTIGYLKQLLANRLRGTSAATYATSTQPKMKSYSPAADFGYGQDHSKTPKKVRGDFVAVYVAIGFITLSVSLGIHTAMQELKNVPNVRVNKKRRETLPEVEDPDRVLDESEKFVKQSFFRKVAHVQENDHDYATMQDSGHADFFAVMPKKAETLKSVGVDPKFRALDH